jgi:hypothetical protein
MLKFASVLHCKITNVFSYVILTEKSLSVQIFGMERKESEPSHVDVDFYVLVDGIIQSPAEIVVIFSRLTIAETSAYMTFPVRPFAGVKTIFTFK